MHTRSFCIPVLHEAGSKKGSPYLYQCTGLGNTKHTSEVVCQYFIILWICYKVTYAIGTNRLYLKSRPTIINWPQTKIKTTCHTPGQHCRSHLSAVLQSAHPSASPFPWPCFHPLHSLSMYMPVQLDPSSFKIKGRTIFFLT